MVPTGGRISRYRLAVIRTFSARTAGLAASILVSGVACGGYDDAEVFGSATTVPGVSESITTAGSTPVEAPVAAADEATGVVPATTVPSTIPLSTAAPSVAVTTPPTAPAATTPATDAANPTQPVASTPVDPSTEGVFPAAAELAVSFTFTPVQGGRRIENPYIAVWVEDIDGNLVKTISLWYEQSEEGPEWLSHLSQWTAVTGADVDASTSGATRVAGSYSVAWDGTASDGTPVPQGDYVVFVESARRGGTYNVTSAPIAIGTAGFSVALPDNGELTSVTAELVV